MPDHVRETEPRVLLSDVQARPGPTGKILRGAVVTAVQAASGRWPAAGRSFLEPLGKRTHTWGAGRPTDGAVTVQGTRDGHADTGHAGDPGRRGARHGCTGRPGQRRDVASGTSGTYGWLPQTLHPGDVIYPDSTAGSTAPQLLYQAVGEQSGRLARRWRQRRECGAEQLTGTGTGWLSA